MGNVENLNGINAISKIMELAEKARVCLFTTNLRSAPLSTSPMSILKADKNGLWFFSSVNSERNKHIENDNKVQLFFLNNRDSEYLTLFGRAYITKDKQKIEELYTPIADIWFKESKNDPELSVIKFVPEDGHYWDTQHNKMVQLVKIVIGTITGKPFDDGLEGEINL